ncbi:tetratricopeptide repeat protein [Sphingomonas sp.]|jgi:tetratricopeptide (TPR) repeat protein|uniref:tetratricopeptide repeat protein n=1 Tax=Sphingomonas sp. TaxID=28214 RepID=UPI002E335BDD|nr:tetratricopeptide repeat protein [Sphingomonas sp.]HEX4693278.1 tetratricopeptide repeat protein [Sphingomonas sp.]
MLLLAIALQAAAAPTPADTRYKACLDLSTSNPPAAEDEAERFRLAGGGARARQCLGLAYAQEERWQDAATAFDAAAREADTAKDTLAPRYWAQAGNAWLAANAPAKAYAALSTALAAGTLEGQDKGEALLDRARSLVAAGQLAPARTDLDAALDAAPQDPLAWLLSATLARRMNDLPRAQGDIDQALKLSADDASVQLEAGNVAAATGNADAAKAAWEKAVKIAPTSPAGQSARAALGQFDAPLPPAAPPAPVPVTRPK